MDGCAYCDLSYCGLGTASAIVLGTLLSVNTSLTWLCLAHNRLGPRAAAALADALCFQTFTHLDLCGNPIGVDGAAALAEALAPLSSSSSPTTTTNSSGGGGGGGGGGGAAAAAAAAAFPPSVRPHGNGRARWRHAAAGAPREGGGGAYAQARAQGARRALRGVDRAAHAHKRRHDDALACRERAGSDGAALVLGSVLRGGKVTSLDLTSNEMGVEGARAVGELLAAAPLGSALISVALEGFALPVRRLMGERTEMGERVPDAISLAKKKLGPLSAVVIACLVGRNAVTTQLNLSGNAIGLAGALALAEATAANAVLQHVDLRHNKLDADAKAAVRAVAPLQVAGRLLISGADSELGDADGGGGGGGGKPGKAGGGGATKPPRHILQVEEARPPTEAAAEQQQQLQQPRRRRRLGSRQAEDGPSELDLCNDANGHRVVVVVVPFAILGETPSTYQSPTPPPRAQSSSGSSGSGSSGCTVTHTQSCQ